MRASLDPSLVVVVDDDRSASDALRAALVAEGAQVVCCRRVADGVAAVDFHRPSAVVVDPEVENGKGWDVAREAHRHGLPFVALDRTGGAIRRVAFAAGADDVIRRPFDATELATRVQALVRRTRPAAQGGAILRHRDLVIDVSAREVRVGGRTVELTPQQFEILRAIVEAGGATLSRSTLLARVAPIEEEPPSERSVDLHVSRLRRRLGETNGEAAYVEAVYGIGYRLAIPEEPPAPAVGERAAAILDALPDAVLVVDRGLHVRYANTYAERLLGVRRAAIIGKRCGELLDCRSCDGRALDGPRCLGLAVLGGAGMLRDEPAVVRAGDGNVPVSFSYGEVRIEGEVPLLTITLHPRSA